MRDVVLGDDHRPGTGRGKLLAVPGIRVKSDLRRTRRLQGGNARHAVRGGAAQLRSDAPCELLQRELRRVGAHGTATYFLGGAGGGGFAGVAVFAAFVSPLPKRSL